jgi:hypothetical protein
MSVFISYAQDDKSRIRKVIGELRSRGIVKEGDEITYAPEIFVPGSSIRGQVRKAIEASSKVVLVWSGAGAESDWVNYEAGMAEALGKPIVVVIPKGGMPRIPSNLDGIEILELENVR